MAICANRADGGFGTFKGDFTTCFEDVLIMPAPAIGLILGFLLCFAVRSRMPGEDPEERAITLQRMQNQSVTKIGTPGYVYDPFVSPRPIGPPAGAWKMSAGHMVILAVYAAMMSVIFAFEILVEVRLSRGQLGIGLRPLIPIALFLLIVSLFVPTHGTNAKARRPRPHYFGWVITITAFTMGMMIVTGIQLHSLINSENILGGDKIDQPPKKVTIDNPYYNASRKIDCCIMLIIYCLSILVYWPLYVLDMRMARKSAY